MIIEIKKIKIILCIYFFITLIYQIQISAATYGSDSTVSIVNPMNIPASTDNIIKTFASAKNGFAFTNLSTTCSWQSIFPVSGPISLKGGTLYLMSDLTLNNTGSFVDLGTIVGANHVIDLSQYNRTFASGTNPNGKLVLNNAAQVTLTRAARSFDWSYDGKYLAVGITSGTGSDLYIYEFTGTSLVLRTSLNISASPYSIRWHPSSYFLAITASASPYFRSYQFTPPSTLTSRGTVTGSSTTYAVAWQARGTHVAFGGTTSTGIRVYSYNTGTGAFSLVATSTNSAALGGTIQYNAIKWAPAGNKDDLIAGTYSSSTVGTLHLYNFTGSALNHLKAYSQGKGIYSLDWCATSTYIAVGCSDGTLRTYQHTAATDTITQKQSNTITGAINSVNWKYDASELAVARAVAATNEFQIYSFDTSSYNFLEKYPIALTTDSYCVRYYYNSTTQSSYIARSDNGTRLLIVYKENYSPFIFRDVNLFLNGDLTLSAPLTFTGNCSIDAQNHRITFTSNGSLNLSPQSNLTISLANLKFTTPSSFALQGGSSNLTLQNSTIEMNTDMYLATGSFNIYNDVTITGPHQFFYNSNFTSTINSNSSLNFTNGAILSIGKSDRSDIEQLAFAENSSSLNLNNATIDLNGYGMNFKRGTLNIVGNTAINIHTDIDIKNTFSMGDGVNSGNDPSIIIQGNGSALALNDGLFVLNPTISSTMIQFYGQSQLSLESTCSINLKKPQQWSDGLIITTTNLTFDIDPTAYLITSNLRVAESNHTQDYYFTGTLKKMPNLILDKNDQIIINPGVLNRNLTIVQDNNLITGPGSFTGLISFENYNSSLTWDLIGSLGSNEIDLNGGHLRITQNANLTANYTFINTGTVDLTNITLDLSPQDSDWAGNIYWVGDGGTIKLNNNVTLDGIWTLSGNIIVDGNSFVLDFNNSGTLILERGAHVTFKNLSLYNLTRQNRIVCKDNDCQITMNFSDFMLAGDYLFETGSLFIYYDSTIGIIDGLDGTFTFTYASTQTSTIDSQCIFEILDGTRFSIGRQDSAITDINQQPLVFADAASSKLILNGGTLHITSSGMILGAGMLEVNHTSNLEIENTVYPYGLILGNGDPAYDFELDIDAGILLTLKYGRLFYNNYFDNRIEFDSQESTLALEHDKGLYAKKNLTLSRGSITTPLSSNITTDKDPDVYVIYQYMHRYDYGHLQDFFLTGTIVSEPTPVSILDSNDTLLLNPGTYNRSILINQDGNKISGVGNISGAINFTDYNSTLSWDLNQPYTAGDIDLNGGRIIYTQDSGIGPQYSFKGSGTIDLTTKTLELGTVSTTWSGNFLWIGDGAIIRMNNDILVDGTWTLSGNITIEGNGYSMDLGTTGTIILERGAQLSLNNFALYNMTQQNGIFCRDNNCQIALNYTDLILADNFLFDKGSLYIYYDSIIMPISADTDTVFTLSYATTQPLLIDSDASLAIWPGIRFSTGRQDSSITDPELQPIIFGDPRTSRFLLDGGSLHITSSGMILTKGTLLARESSNLEIENSSYPYGLIFGDTTPENDFNLGLDAGTQLTLKTGRLFYNNYADDKINFASAESTFAIEISNGLFAKRNLTINQGTIATPLIPNVPVGRDPNINIIYKNMHRYDYSHILDFYITGSARVIPTPATILDTNDKLLINPGSFDRPIVINKYGNSISGMGNVSGQIIFTDASSTLTWDINQTYAGPSIDLKGGRIVFTQDSGLENGNSFVGTGTVELTNKIFQLGTDIKTWSGDLYWIGDGASIVLNNNITIDGTWTLSGNITIEGNNYLIDLAPTGSIILERGANVTFKDFSVFNMSRQNRITCNDNSCQLTLNIADLLMSGDYLWDKGSIYTYYNSRIGVIDGLDKVCTFSYESTRTSTIDSFAFLKILPNTRFSIGRQNSIISNPEQQPLIFIDPATSKLILDGGTLHVTSSGMIMTAGKIETLNYSSIEVENTKYPYGLILGNGVAEKDFELNIGGGYQLELTSGSVFYNNYSPDRVIFGSPASSLYVVPTNGLKTKTNLTLQNGTLESTGMAIDKDANVEIYLNNIIRIFHTPYYSVMKMTAYDNCPTYKLSNGDSLHLVEGYTTKDVVADSGFSIFGGISGFAGTLTLKNNSVTLQSDLQTPCFSNITLNGGTFIVSSDGSFAADKTFTGSGKVQLLGTKMAFGPTTDMNMTNTIYWQGITKGSIELNAQKTSLSSTWTIGGNVVLNGKGNILDLSNKGKLTIRPNSTLSLENISLKGLGQNLGNINFMDDTATLRLANAYLELDNDLSTTIGKIYVNGPTIVGLKNHNWTLDQNASMTVDGVTLWQDPLDQETGGKIKFGTGSIDNYLTLISSGTIKTATSLDILTTETTDLQQQITNNSNAIIKLDGTVRTDSNAFAYGIKNNSNTLLALNRTTSNALLFGDRNNSNSIVLLDRKVRVNSNAMLYLNRTTSNALLFGDRNNSNAIITLNRTVRTNSNAFAYGIKNNSNTLLALNRTTSNALLFGDRNNSNAIITLNRTVRTNSNAFAYGIKNNSNAIKFETDHFISINDGKVTALGAINDSTNIDGLGLLSSPIDLQNGTLTLNSDLILSNQSTIESSGNFDLQGNAIILGGNLIVPANTSIKIISSGVLDGQGHALELLTNAKLIVDNNATLTLRNMTWMSHESNWPIEMQTATSKLTLQNSALCFDRDLTFTQGQLFIHGDVFVTGTNKFSYASTETSYVAPHSTLYFDTNSTFSYSPRLTNRHTRSERNLIKLIDKTSSIFFDECSLQLPDSGWRLTNGTIYFNNKVKIYGQPTQDNSFEFGNAISSDDLDINILSGANIENYGYVNYNNVG